MSPIFWGIIAVGALMFATWVLSVKLANASIVDIVWGLGFVTMGWTVWVAHHRATDAISIALLTMVTLWGLRLAGYLWWRNHGKGEDFRYVAMRRKIGPNFWLVSLVSVFLLQGVLVVVVSLPLSVGLNRSHIGVGPVGYVGFALFAVGLFFEAVGDLQLARFKADPANAGAVMDRGLWRYTRHPNYFGDFCVWWAIFLVSLNCGPVWWTVIGPVVMSVLLMRVSGVALLEKSIGKRRPKYADYIARTSAFFPRPPKRLPNQQPGGGAAPTDRPE